MKILNAGSNNLHEVEPGGISVKPLIKLKILVKRDQKKFTVEKIKCAIGP